MWRCPVFLVFILTTMMVEARYTRISYVSDPVELLLKDAYSSLKNRDNYYKRQPVRRQISKRKYSPFPPSFYSSLGFGPTFHRRQMSLPYTDLLFSGK